MKKVGHFESPSRNELCNPLTRQKRNVVAKFHPDWRSDLAGEVKIRDGRMEGQMDRRCTTTTPYLEFQLQIS